MKMLQQQRGGTLIVSLIFLVVLTVIGLSGMESSTFEVKVARSVKSQMDAFTNAEDALHEGENQICGLQEKPNSCDGGFTEDLDATTSDGFYVGNTLSLADLPDYLGNSLNKEAVTSGAVNSYVIEYLGVVTPHGGSLNAGQSGAEKRYLFRVTGYGESNKGGSKMTQSYYTTAD